MRADIIINSNSVATSRRSAELDADDLVVSAAAAAPPGVHADALSPRSLKVWVTLADVGALAVGFLLAFVVQSQLRPIPERIVVEQVGFVLASLPAFAIGAGINRLYLARAILRPAEEAGRVVRTVAFGIGFILVLSVAVKYEPLSRLWLVLSAGCVTGAALLERRIVRRMFTRLRQSRRLRRRIIIVGTDVHAVGLLHSYQRDPALGYEVVGFVGDDDLGVREGVSVLGAVTELHRLLKEHRAVGVVVSIPGVGPDLVNSLTRRLTDDGYHVALSSSLRDIHVGRLRPQELDGQTLIYVERTLRGGWRAVAKRVFDAVAAGTILVLSTPVLLASALAIKLTSPGPVLFKQQRVGLDGKPFQLYKLRTMVIDAEQRLEELRSLSEVDGPIFKMSRDPRITRVGAILRKFSIDELPQLYCVLRGTMSMVGPRPMLPAEAEQLDAVVLSERVRVLPGLTGLWQVSGRSDTSFESYCRLDQYYVDNWTLGHDLQICVRTVGVVMFGKGAM